MKAISDVRDEFDAIARAGAERPDPPGLYDDFVLSVVPNESASVLEIGCGTGCFTRRLARRARRVTAIDVSPEMVAIARRRAAAANIEYHVGDLFDMASGLGTFDCVVTLQTFHHLPAEAGAECLKRCVAPGGLLILHDLWRVETMADRCLDVARLAFKALRLLAMRAPLRHSPGERAAWAAHARDDVHPTMSDVDALQRRHFPGAAVHRHLLWRYTLVWRNG